MAFKPVKRRNTVIYLPGHFITSFRISCGMVRRNWIFTQSGNSQTNVDSSKPLLKLDALVRNLVKAS